MSGEKRPILVKLGNPHLRFSRSEWKDLEDAYGAKIPNVVRDAVDTSIHWWLSAFEFADGSGRHDIQRICKNIENAAKRLDKLVDQLVELDDMLAIEVLPESVAAPEWKTTLSALQQTRAMVETMYTNAPEPDKHQVLINFIVKNFKSNSLTVTVTRYNSSGRHKPSPFVKFVAALGRMEPRLKIPNYDDSLQSQINLSDWVYHRIP